MIMTVVRRNYLAIVNLYRQSCAVAAVVAVAAVADVAAVPAVPVVQQ